MLSHSVSPIRQVPRFCKLTRLTLGCLAACSTAQVQGDPWFPTDGNDSVEIAVPARPSAWRSATSPSLGTTLDMLAIRLSEVRGARDLDIAVAEFDAADTQDCGFANYLADALTNRLLSSQRFRTVSERRLIDQGLREQGLQSGSFLIDPRRRVQVGKLLGATALVVGSFVGSADGVDISARLIEVTTGRVLQAAEVSAIRDRKLDRLLCDREEPANPHPSRVQKYAGQNRGDTLPIGFAFGECEPLRPGVGVVDIEGPFSTLPRHAYIDMGFDYGQEVWTEVELDGRPLPLCGRKERLQINGRMVDLAPPHARVRVVVENPETRMRLRRQCWARNPVTGKFNRRGTGDFETIAAGNYTGWAQSCSFGP